MNIYRSFGATKKLKFYSISAYASIFALFVLAITSSVSNAQSIGKYIVCVRAGCTNYSDYPSAYASLDTYFPLYKYKAEYSKNNWTESYAVPLERPETIVYNWNSEDSEKKALDSIIAEVKQKIGEFTYTVEGAYYEDPKFVNMDSGERISFGSRLINITGKDGYTDHRSIEKKASFTCRSRYSTVGFDAVYYTPPEHRFLSILCKSTYSPSIASQVLQVDSCPANGQPCFPATGDKARFEKDLEFPIGPFIRSYHSMQQTFAPGMAPGWTHSYAQKLFFDSNGSLFANDEKGNLEPYITTEPWVSGHSASFPGRTVNKVGSIYKMVDQGDLIKTFDTSGKLIAIDSRSAPQKSVTLSYDELGRLSYVTDATGRQLVLKYTDDTVMGLLAGIASSDGQTVTYGYDTSRNLVSAETPGYTRTYHYAETGLATAQMLHHLTGISENNVRYATFSYDAKGRPINSTLHASVSDKADTTTITYNDTNGSASVVRPTGENRAYNYVGPQITKMSYGTGSYNYYHFWLNGVGWLTDASDPRGTKTAIAYADSFTYPNVTTEAAATPQERKKTIQRDHSMQVVRSLVSGTEQTQLGRQLKAIKRDDSGRPLAYCGYDNSSSDDNYPCGSAANAPAGVRQTTLTYCTAADAAAPNTGCPLEGLLKAADGPRVDVSDTTAFAYYTDNDAGCGQACGHKKGDLWKITTALGQVTEYLSYDGAGRVLSVRDANGLTTDYAYHPRGWLITSTVRGADNASNRATSIDYWPTGLVKQVTQPDGAFTAFTYDTAHRLTDIADNAGNTLHYTLDNAGNRVKEDTKDASGALKRTLSRVYNQLGQLATQATAKGDPTDFGYDLSGNTGTVTDALGHKTQNDYDPLNRLARTLQDVGGIAAETKFGYDAFDNLIKVTDPKGLDTTYAYNGLGDLTTRTSPDTGVTTYTYDSAGNRATQTDARNIKTTYSYDALNRLTRVAYPTTSLNVTYTYDVSQTTCASGETYAVGRLARMQDGSGTTDYCYDRFGDLVRKVQTTNGKVFVLRYAYTKAGQLSRLTYPDGAAVDYVRNTQGQTTEVGVTPAGGTRQVLLGNATYYPFGPVASWSYGNGRPMQRVLDQDYRPLAVSDTRSDGLSTGFAFDPAGNLSALTAAGNTAPVVSLDYDALGRLTAFKDGPTGAVIDGYSYDATGNRLSAKVNTITQSYTYPTTNHRLSAVAGTARTYDAIGNTLSIGGTAQEFAYDATGRMNQAKRAGTVVMKYGYNGRGEQVRRVDKTNTYTLYDESGHWLGNYDANGATLQQAIWLDDLPVGVLAKNSVRYVQPDHLGTPRAVIDPVRDVAIWTWDLKGEAFGNTPPDQDPDKDGTAFVFDMRFPGQRYDAASGLNQNYYRDFSPPDGRYVQSDPIGLPASISTYAYVDSNPIDSIDSFGLQASRLVGTRFGAAPYSADQRDLSSGQRYADPTLTAPSKMQLGLLAFTAVSSIPFMAPYATAIGTSCLSEDKSDCDRQWENAFKRCRELIYEQMLQRAGRKKKRSVTGVTGGYTDLYRCAAGLVSERCGGNAVDYGD
ncbi:RHS repeat protein [Xanthomonas campestris pv. phormiicola]|nr:RHS repeat protein [Xanthomonas campestris pv. phormiicola]UYC17414.1 RHS repeat protein [Xanthomonas campestris pv. phormiicola]